MFYRVDFTLNFLYLAGKTEFDKSWQWPGVSWICRAGGGISHDYESSNTE